ncbi:MAG: FAD-binding oxidoreductase [Rudaea sp.]|uniref:FAD-binding oxidoreductase n=1 Tax=Rudaea sp. TaxID=2136325 RepID=UPI0039E48C6B
MSAPFPTRDFTASGDPVTHLGARLLRRGEDGFDAAVAAAVWRMNKPARTPAAVVLAQDEADVVAAMRLTKAEGLQVGVRSGGHSWTSPHVRDGALLLDVSRLNNFSIDADTMSAWVQPGLKGRVLNEALGEQGLMFPGGHHNSVGLGGFLLAGGWGWNMRRWGNGAEQVLAARIVTPDGEVIEADANRNADWYWAVRGAGPGFFGAVVGYTLRIHRRPAHITRNVIVVGEDQLDAALTWLRAQAEHVPAHLEMFANAACFDENGECTPLKLSLVGISFGENDAETEQSAALFDICPVADQASVRLRAAPVTLGELYEMASEADPEGLRFACDNINTNAPASELVPAVRELFTTLPTPRSHIYWLNWGKPRQREDMALSMQSTVYIAVYTLWDDPAQDEAMTRWPVEQMRKLESLACGAQTNDENMARRPAAYFSEQARTRLEALRQRHDPQHRFVSFLERP